jgi:hypothetical protein
MDWAAGAMDWAAGAREKVTEKEDEATATATARVKDWGWGWVTAMDLGWACCSQVQGTCRSSLDSSRHSSRLCWRSPARSSTRT